MGSHVKGRPLFRLDPGWLFLLPGLVILAATVLMPALDDLARAEGNRERALALETYRSARLAKHLEYLDALERGDETILRSLAADQLNLAPSDQRVIIAPVGVGGIGGGWADVGSAGGMWASASVLDRLDAPYAAPTIALPPDSMLHRLTTNRHTRLWMIAGAATCVLYALLPPARRPDRARSRASSRAWRWRGMLIPARLRQGRVLMFER